MRNPGIVVVVGDVEGPVAVGRRHSSNRRSLGLGKLVVIQPDLKPDSLRSHLMPVSRTAIATSGCRD